MSNKSALTISGAGIGNTIIQAPVASQVAINYVGSQSLTISNLTMESVPQNLSIALESNAAIGPNASAYPLNLSQVRITGFGDTAGLNFGVLVVTACTIDGNGFGPGDGAFYNEGSGELDITASTISGNTGLTAGGVVSLGYLNIETSTFDGNTGQWGGALYVFGGDNPDGDAARLLLHQSTITNNSSTDDTHDGSGGIYWDGGNAGLGGSYFEVSSSTIVNNHSASSGGGLFVLPGGSGTMEFGECIIANNTAAGSGPDVSGDMSYAGDNLVSSSAGITNMPTTWKVGNPMLGLYASVDNLPKVYALLPGSPAIDAGPSGVSQTFDERGFPRPLSWNGQGTPKADWGAVEYDPWQIERLTVAARSTDTFSISNDTGYSNQQGGWLQANATNDFVTFTVPVPVAATYDVKVRSKFGNNRGIYRLSTATTLTGTYTNLGGTQDQYTSASNDFVEVDLGNITFSSSGNKYFKFTVTGKNTSSTGYYLTLDYLKLTQQP